MSAMRYSGAVRVRVTYVEPRCDTTIDSMLARRYPHGRYRCVVSVPLSGKIREVVWTAPPAVLDKAVDCSEAYDEAAHAALSFADECMGSLEEWAEFKEDGSGWAIRRSPGRGFGH